MNAIKLNKDQYLRSLKAKNVNHLWLYSKSDTRQRTHNNSIFLGRTIGMPTACVVILYGTTICDEEIEDIFGKGYFIDGGISPDDKENMSYDCFYLK